MHCADNGAQKLSIDIYYRYTVSGSITIFEAQSIKLPFHPTSYVSSSADKKTVSTRFASSWGYYESGNFFLDNRIR